MTASAFPTTQEASPFGLAANAIEIPERNTHIPAHYVRNQHADPENTIVTENGIPVLGVDKQPFTVSQVAPERRYAIGPDGEVLPRNDFTQIHQQAVLEFYALARSRNPDVKFDGNPALIHIPNPADWVKWRVDPEDNTKLIQIGFDPKATAGAKPETFVDGDGEAIAGSRIEHLCNAYANPKLRRALTAGEVAEVEEYLDISGGAPGAGSIATKLEQLTELHAEGLLTTEQYAEKVAALTGVVSDKPEPEAEPEPEAGSFMVEAKCGFVARGKTERGANFGKAAHERGCDVCGEIGDKEEDTG